MTLKLRIDISVEIEAIDFIEAAGHQGAFQHHLDALQIDYPQASMTIRERRGPRLTPVKRAETLRRSGTVLPYAERVREAS
jgi:hypothetical protein